MYTDKEYLQSLLKSKFVTNNGTKAALKRAIKNIGSRPLEKRVMPKITEVEFRPDINDVDEIVLKNGGIHLEFMDDNYAWMSISDDTKQETLYHVHIQLKDPKSRKHLKIWAEKLFID